MKTLHPLSLPLGALVAFGAVLSGCDPCDAGPGTICTYAGTGEAAFNGDGLDRGATSFYWPQKVRFMPDGRPLVMDWNNHRVRVIGEDGKISTVIGNENIGDGPEDNGDLEQPGVDGRKVNLNHPTDLVFLPDGKGLLASWHNHKLRVWDPASNNVYVACGRGAGFKGDGAAAVGADALFDQPRSLVVDPDGNIYIADQRNQRVRRIRGSDKVLETVVGTGVKGFSGDDGAPLAAQVSFPAGTNPQPGGALAMDSKGRLFIADTENHRIRMVDFAANTIVTVAGTGEQGYSGDGADAKSATFKYPRDLAIGPDDNLYVADTENNAIRKVDLASGVTSTVVGDGTKAFEGDGAPAETARLARPYGITFDAEGNLFIADTFNNRVRRVTAWGN